MTLENRKQKTENGFTLIETLIAVSILTLSVAGPLYTASRAIISAETARDQLVASYLAQEGIEYVRALRDDRYLSAYRDTPATASSDGWSGFLTAIAGCQTSTIGSAPFCTFDATGGGGTGSLAVCPSGVCQKLWLSPAKIYWQSQSGTVTPFTRTIQAVDSAPGMKIVSKVSWSFHNIPYSVTITDDLTPWQ